MQKQSVFKSMVFCMKGKKNWSFIDDKYQTIHLGFFVLGRIVDGANEQLALQTWKNEGHSKERNKGIFWVPWMFTVSPMRETELFLIVSCMNNYFASCVWKSLHKCICIQVSLSVVWSEVSWLLNKFCMCSYYLCMCSSLRACNKQLNYIKVPVISVSYSWYFLRRPFVF